MSTGTSKSHITRSPRSETRSLNHRLHTHTLTHTSNRIVAPTTGDTQGLRSLGFGALAES